MDFLQWVSWDGEICRLGQLILTQSLPYFDWIGLLRMPISSGPIRNVCDLTEKNS
jgi:hypothetical protein